MKLKKFALISEITAGFAVVVTLIILIVELRENTATIQATNRQSISARIEERTIAIATSPQLSRLLEKAQKPGEIESGSTEWWQLSSLYVGLMTATEDAYLQNREGRLDQEFFEARARRSLRLLDNPVGREFFRRARKEERYVPEYLDWVDRSLFH
jgi:hypothetical protein